MSVPRRVVLPVKEMLTMQIRLHHRRGVRALRLLDHPRFRAAYDLLLLRTEVGEEPQELADWWTKIQTASHQEQREMAGMGKGKSSRAPVDANKKPRRRRPRRKKTPD